MYESKKCVNFRVDGMDVPYTTPFESKESDMHWMSYGNFTGGCPSKGSQWQSTRFGVFDQVTVVNYEKIRDIQIVVDELIFLEWVRTRSFNVRSQRYGLWKLSPDSDWIWIQVGATVGNS